MADVNFSIGMVGITGYLLVNARTVANPTVVEQTSGHLPGPQPSVRNMSWTGLSPEMTYFDFRETNGTGLGVLLSTFTFDVKNNRVVAEKRFYIGDGPHSYDPVSGQSQIVDPYLDGKTIIGVFRQGYGFLQPTDADGTKEYSLVTGGGIQLEDYGSTPRPVFGAGEVYAIDINYLFNYGNTTIGNPYNKYTELTGDTALSNAEKNGRVACISAGSRMVLTLPALASLGEADYYYITSYNGAQLQVKIVTTGLQVINFNGELDQEISIGRNEFIWIEKRGAKFDVVQHHPGIEKVGERFAATSLLHPNTMPEDGRLLDGDDYPRLWKWLADQPAANVVDIPEATLINGAFIQDVGKEGLFYRSTTTKKFRMPNTQGWSERGIKSFAGAGGTDASRTYDYPGGTQPEKVGRHTHQFNIGNGVGGQAMPDYNPADLNTTRAQAVTLANGANGDENTVRNVGVIYLRRT